MRVLSQWLGLVVMGTSSSGTHATLTVVSSIENRGPLIVTIITARPRRYALTRDESARASSQT
jgi:hypothetical protein